MRCPYPMALWPADLAKTAVLTVWRERYGASPTGGLDWLAGGWRGGGRLAASLRLSPMTGQP